MNIIAILVIKISAKKFDYSDALTGDNLNRLIIRLPVLHNADGSVHIDEEKNYSDNGYIPDWTFMEKYMKNIEEKAQIRIDLLNSIIM